MTTAGLPAGAADRPLLRARRAGRLDHLAQAGAAGRAGEHGRGARADRQRRHGGHRARRGGRPAPRCACCGQRRRGAGRLADQRLRQRPARAAASPRSPPRSCRASEVSLSSVVLPEMREYERALTTVANGYVQPQVARYVAQPRRPAHRRGRAGRAVDPAQRRRPVRRPSAADLGPVTMLLSGPAGGVTGAVWVAEQSGYTDLLTFDMGGTSTDVALVQNGRPGSAGRPRSATSPSGRPSVDVRTVGAGGGSIAHVPELTKALRVGPQSAGAEPGPAAYGKGGSDPTVTDANVVLGYLPTALAGGEITLDRRGRPRRGADRSPTRWACPAPRPPRPASSTSSTRTCSAALRLVSVQQGFDPRDFALVAFGGAGPLHANALGRLTGAWPVIVPPSPGVLCALGDATTSPARRVGPHLPAPVRRPDRRRAARRSSPSWPTPPPPRLVAQGVRPSRPAPIDLPGRHPLSSGRASRSRSPSTPGWTTRRRVRAARPALRRRARAALLLPARAPSTSWSTRGPRSPGRGRRSPPTALDRGRRRPGRRPDRRHPDLRRRRLRRRRPSTTG